MTDGDIIADDAWRTGVDVQHCAILHICPCPDPNRRDVAAKHCAKPDARVQSNVDIPDNDASRREENAVGDTRRDAVDA